MSATRDADLAFSFTTPTSSSTSTARPVVNHVQQTLLHPVVDASTFNVNGQTYRVVDIHVSLDFAFTTSTTTNCFNFIFKIDIAGRPSTTLARDDDSTRHRHPRRQVQLQFHDDHHHLVLLRHEHRTRSFNYF
jgi:hypothetical protein